MQLGGVLLGAGMEMVIDAADHRGNDTVHFVLRTVVETRQEDGDTWVVLDGTEHDRACWLPRRIQVRVAALKRSLTLGR